MRLLLIEDDEDIAETLVAYLEKNGFVVDVAPTLAVAKVAVMENSFDLVLLDRMLPDGEGMTMLKFFADKDRPQRVILLTALGDVDDRVRGLEDGALDYIPKPFEPRELLARIRNALRQPISVERTVKTLGPLQYDVESRAFSVNGEQLNLRRTEALVLEALIARPASLVPRESLESKVYGYDKFVSSNSLESQVSRLRKTLSEHTDAIKIQTVRGMGYRLITQS